jgi:hypothetical protein
MWLIKYLKIDYYCRKYSDYVNLLFEICPKFKMEIYSDIFGQNG